MDHKVPQKVIYTLLVKTKHNKTKTNEVWYKANKGTGQGEGQDIDIY